MLLDLLLGACPSFLTVEIDNDKPDVGQVLEETAEFIQLLLHRWRDTQSRLESLTSSCTSSTVVRVNWHLTCGCMDMTPSSLGEMPSLHRYQVVTGLSKAETTMSTFQSGRAGER